MRNIRSVITNPPTIRRRTDDRDKTKNRAYCVVVRARGYDRTNQREMEIALVADINGVCSRGGTREITW